MIKSSALGRTFLIVALYRMTNGAETLPEPKNPVD